MTTVLAVLAIVAAALLGAFVSVEAALAVPAVALVVVVVLVAQRGLGGGTRTPAAIPTAAPVESETALPLARLVFAALVVHWTAAIVLNITPIWRGFAPDAVFYELSGRAIVKSWTDPTIDLRLWFGRTDNIKFYPYLNAVCIWLFDTARWPMSLLNGAISVLAAYLAGQLSSSMYGHAVGRRTFILCAFFPSLVTWTSMNIREAWSFLILILIVRSAFYLRRRFNPLDLLVLVGCLFWLGFVRSYLVPLMLLAVLASFFIVRWSQIPYAFVGLTVLGLLMATVGDSLGLSVDAVSSENLVAVQAMRENLSFGGSAYGADADTTTISGALLYLPEGVLRFLFAPFPWAVTSTLQALAVPETLVWYFFFYQAVRGAWVAVKEDAPKSVLVGAVLLLITCAYALASGNEGTAYRHRAQVMLFFFFFTALNQVRRAQAAQAPVARSLAVERV